MGKPSMCASIRKRAVHPHAHVYTAHVYKSYTYAHARARPIPPKPPPSRTHAHTHKPVYPAHTRIPHALHAVHTMAYTSFFITLRVPQAGAPLCKEACGCHGHCVERCAGQLSANRTSAEHFERHGR